MKNPHIKSKLFQGKFPKLFKAPEPSNILWPNLKYSKCNLCMRRFFIAIVSLLLMVGSFVAIVYAKNYELYVQLKYNMNMNCGSAVYTQSQVIYQEDQ